MKLRLENDKKYEVIGLNPREFCTEMKKELFAETLYMMNDKEVEDIQKIVGDCIEIEAEILEENDVNRISVYSYNGKIWIIKQKEINMRQLFEMLMEIRTFATEDCLKKCLVLMDFFGKLFFSVLDGEVRDVYYYLSKEYFLKGKMFNNTNVYDDITEYFLEYKKNSISKTEISYILKKLEELNVIEFYNGNLIVKDKVLLG